MMSDQDVQKPVEQPRYDRRHIELIRKIIQRTKEKKLSWKRDRNMFRAVVPPDMVITLTESPTLQRWSGFNVRTADGDLIRINNQPNILFMLIRVPEEMLQSINELYTFVSGLGSPEIERAIERLDKL
jgi:hypothetical protein